MMNKFDQNNDYKIDFSLIDGRVVQPMDQESFKEKQSTIQKDPEVEKFVEEQVIPSKSKPFSVDESTSSSGRIYNEPKVIHRPESVINSVDKQESKQQQPPQAQDECSDESIAGGEDWKFWRVVEDLNFLKPRFYAPKVGRTVASEPAGAEKKQNEQAFKSVKFDNKAARKMAKKNKVRSYRWLRVILWILLSISLAWAVYSVYEKFIEGKDLPMLGGVGLVNMNNSSMSPTINQGDLCVVVRQHNYLVDSNIAYSSEDNGLVVHRFIGMDNNGKCRAKGIATRNLDKPFEKDKIYGKVMLSIPFIGFLVTPIFNFCFILLMVGCLIICYRWKAKKKRT